MRPVCMETLSSSLKFSVHVLRSLELRKRVRSSWYVVDSVPDPAVDGLYGIRTAKALDRFY